MKGPSNWKVDVKGPVGRIEGSSLIILSLTAALSLEFFIQ